MQWVAGLGRWRALFEVGRLEIDIIHAYHKDTLRIQAFTAYISSLGDATHFRDTMSGKFAQSVRVSSSMRR